MQGVLNGLYEHNALRATHVSGSSAGGSNNFVGCDKKYCQNSGMNNE
jgi:hypothetical protein